MDGRNSGTNSKMSDRGPSPIVNVLIVGTSGIVGKIADAPIERIKLLLQSQREIINAGRMSEPYKGITNCAIRIYRTEGLLAFWRGNLIACMGVIPRHLLTLGLQQKFKQLRPASKTYGRGTNIAISVSTGVAASFVSMLLTYPIDYCRVRMASDVIFTDKGVNQRQFKGIIDVYQKTWASDGIVGMYRGFLVSCFGIGVYRGFYFGFYDTMRSGLLGDSPSILSSFAIGVSATLLAGLVAYPFDTIRVRMMMRSIEPVKYKGSVQCALQILRNEGFRPLMNGAMTVILRMVCGGIILGSYDTLRLRFTK